MKTLPTNRILLGDALTVTKTLPAESVDCIVTSPPYFRLRYGVDNQLGLEPHVDQWVGELRDLARELHRALKPSGTFWLRLGDSYSTHPREGAPRKSLLGAPERLLLALVEDAWTIRNKIVWAKTNPMPTSVRDRLSTTHEFVYLLTKHRGTTSHSMTSASRTGAGHRTATTRAAQASTPLAPRHLAPTATATTDSEHSRLAASSAIHSARTPAMSGTSPPRTTRTPTSRRSPRRWFAACSAPDVHPAAWCSIPSWAPGPRPSLPKQKGATGSAASSTRSSSGKQKPARQ